MRGFFYIAAIVLVLCSVLQAAPDSLLIQRYTIDNGLQTNNIRRLLEDDGGYLWLGTEEGLFRFDGYKFKAMGDSADGAPGLKNERVLCMHRDRSGALWFATALKLYRYTSAKNRFTPFQLHDNSSRGIPGSTVFGMMETRDGAVHAVTDEGVSTYRGPSEGFKHFPYDARLNINFLSEFSFTEAGDVVYMAIAGSLAGWDRGSRSVKVIARTEIDPVLKRPDHFRKVYPESDSTILIVNRVALYRCNTTTGTAVRLKSFDSDCSSTSISGKTVWIGFLDGRLASFDMNTGDFRVRSLPSRVPAQPVLSGKHTLSYHPQSMFVDSRGHIWYQCGDLGVLIYHPESDALEVLTARNLDFPSAGTMIEDRTGCIWFAAPGKDLLRIERHIARLQACQPDNQLSNLPMSSSNNVRGFLQWDEHSLLLATLSGLLYFDMGSGSTRRVPWIPAPLEELHTFPIWCLERDSKGRIWIGTGGMGLIILDPATGKHLRLNTISPPALRISDRRVRCITLDADYGAWIGTWNGIDFIDTRTLDVEDTASVQLRHYRFDPDDPGSLSNNLIFDLHQDRHGILWVATENGLNAFQPDSQSFFRYQHRSEDRNSISSSNVRAVFEDADGVMWFGTHGGGLNRYVSSTGTFTSVQQSDGLPSNIVYSILQDKSGDLWLGTHHGLCRYDPKNNSIRKFGLRDGLLHRELNTIAALTAIDGQMFFGGGAGFNYFYPDRIHDLLPPPLPAITGMMLRNSEIHISDEFITLGPDDNFVSFEFSAMSNFSSEANRYRYKLDGVDENWVESGERHFASYTELHPGRYVFRVMASNSEGRWSSTAATISFEILKPWWSTNWALASYLLALVLLILLANRIQRHRVLSRERVRTSIRESELRMQTTEAENKALLAEKRIREHEIEQSEEIRRTYVALAAAHEKLELAQQQLSTVIAAAPIVLFALDVEGVFTISDGAGLQQLGLAPGAIVGRSVFDLYRNEPEVLDAMRQALLGEDLIRRLTMRGLTFEVRTSGIRDDAGKLVGIIGIATDITEDLITQHELVKLSSAVEQSPAIVIITNTEGLVEYVNPTFTAVSGYNADEILGQNPRVLKSGDMSAEAYKSLWLTLKAGAQWRGELHNRKKDGSAYWVSASISPLKNQDGETTHYIGIQEDITERKRTEEILERRTEELETIDTIVQVVNSELEFEKVVHTLLEQGMRLLPHADKAVAFMYDSTSDCFSLIDTVGYDFKGKSFAFSREELTARYIMSTERLENGVYILHHRHDLAGEARLGTLPRARSMLIMALSFSSSYLFDDGFLVFDSMTDHDAFGIADAHKLTRFRQHAISALAKASTLQTLKLRNEEILRTQAQLVVQEKLASLGRLTAGIAHEIQNPLNFVNNFAEVSAELMNDLMDAMEDPDERLALLRELQRSVGKVHEHGKRAQGIVGSMMMHARSSTDDREWVDPNGLLRQAATLAEHSARSNRAVCDPEIVLDLKEGISLIHVVPQELSRVFLNLLQNAMDAVCEKRQGAEAGTFTPKIEVRSRELEHAVEFQIRDNGYGIPESVREHIFEPFFTTKAPGQGTGLGLSISYDIIRQNYNGSFTVESKENEFTEFTIAIPLT